jgi:hypothetical protein
MAPAARPHFDLGLLEQDDTPGVGYPVAAMAQVVDNGAGVVGNRLAGAGLEPS